MMQDQRDQSIKLQMDKRNQLKDRGQMAEHDLDRYEAFSKDKHAQFLAASAASDADLARQLQMTAAKYAGPEAQQRAQAAIAALGQSSVDKQRQAVEVASQHDVKQQELGLQKQQVGIAAGHLALATTDANRNYAEGVRRWDLERTDKLKEEEAKAAAAGNTALAGQIKDVRETGLGNPVTGEPLLNDKGRAIMASADSLETQARKSSPEQLKSFADNLRKTGNATAQQTDAQAVQGYADSLRKRAAVEGVALAPDKEVRKELTPIIASSQNVIDGLQKIKDYLKTDPGVTDREGWAQVGTELGTTMEKWAKMEGMKYTNREAGALDEHIFQFNPHSVFQRVFDKGKVLAQVKALEDEVKGSVDATLKANQVKAEWTPTSSSASPLDRFTEPTSAEEGARAEPGLAERAAMRIGHPITGADTEGAKLDAETKSNAASGPTGLDPYATERLTTMANKYDGASNAQRELILSNVLAPIKANPIALSAKNAPETPVGRESLTWGMLRTIQATSPELYKDVLSRLPKLQRDEIVKFAPPLDKPSLLAVPPGR
jgi:hypothetical protein